MANASAYKEFNGWTNKPYTEVFEYDFANDGGTAATYSLGKFLHKTLVLRGIVFVETACTSGGSATVIVGASTADTDGFLDATSGAVANLTDNAVLTETSGTNLVVAADETLDLTIGVAALTAGKIKVVLECMNVE